MKPAFVKWAALVALGCAGAAVLALPFPKVSPEDGWRTENEIVRTERSRLRGASMVLDEAVSELRALEAESRAAVAARRSAPITVDPSVPPPLRGVVDSLSNAAWRALGDGASAEWAGLVVYFDSGGIDLARRVPEPRRNADLVFVLPSPETLGRCMAVVRLRRSEQWVLPRTERLLGPCAFYARFGAPGPAVDSWLHASRFAFARLTAQRAAASEPFTNPRQPLLLPPPAARCLNGRDPRCEAALALAGERSAREASGSNIGAGKREHRLRALGPLAARASDFGDRLGAGEERMLAEMLADAGAERFRAFWSSSDEDVAAAFRQATGTALDDWTRRWLERASGPRAAGMLPDRSNVLWLSLVIPLFTLGALRRREHVMWGGRPGR